MSALSPSCLSQKLTANKSDDQIVTSENLSWKHAGNGKKHKNYSQRTNRQTFNNTQNQNQNQSQPPINMHMQMNLSPMTKEIEKLREHLSDLINSMI